MATPNLRTDLHIVQLPNTFPNVGGLTGANTVVADPDFGAKIARLTDGNASTGPKFSSMQTAAEAENQIWNADDTMLFVRDNSGKSYLYQFDPVTMTGKQLPFTSGAHLSFSSVTPGILYSLSKTTGVVSQLTFALVSGTWTLQTTTTLCDFKNILPGGFSFNWVGSFLHSNDDTVFGTAFSNGGVQGTGIYACIFKVGSGFRMFNTNTGAITGDWGPTGAAVITNWGGSLPFTIHDVVQTQNPDFYETQVSGSQGSLEWQISTLNIRNCKASGHYGHGYLSVFPSGAGGGQVSQATYANPSVITKLIPNALLPAGQVPPQHYTGDQHHGFQKTTNDQVLLWTTNGPPAIFPFTSCWMGEVRGCDVSGVVSGTVGVMYRACHTFNSCKSNQFIVQNAIGNVSQTGNFIAFTSDWAGANTIGPLGSTSGAPTGTVGVDARGDVFIVQIPFATSAPTITSANNTTFTQNVFGSFAVNTTGSPLPSISESGSLPTGVTFVDNGNGTATLSGTPTVSGTFVFTITAANGILPNATQPFTLTVSPVVPPVAPQITSADSTTFTELVGNSFSINSTGTPTPTLSETGTLPPGISFTDNGNGTGNLGGTPTAIGIYPITFTAANGVPPNAVQPFNLMVGAPSPKAVVTGTFQDPSGKPIANGSYEWKLSADSINFSIAATVPTMIGGTLDANGSLTTTLAFNDRLSTVLGFSTNYQLTVKDKNGTQVWNEHYHLTGTAANLNLLPPGGN